MTPSIVGAAASIANSKAKSITKPNIQQINEVPSPGIEFFKNEYRLRAHNILHFFMANPVIHKGN